MMESKGKRAGRVATGVEPADEAAEPIATTTASEPVAPIQVTALPSPVSRAPTAEALGDLSGDAFAAVAESQAAFARGLDELSVEAAAVARRGIDAAAKSATEMLAVKTLADAIEVNAGFARRSFEAFVGGSARLSELGIKFAADAAEPILAQFSRSWLKAARFGQ